MTQTQHFFSSKSIIKLVLIRNGFDKKIEHHNIPLPEETSNLAKLPLDDGEPKQNQTDHN